MYNYKLNIAYDGTKYSGWQRNKNAPDTIQNKLDTIFTKYFNEKIEIIGAGRTDKGVHAKNMVANFHCSHLIDVSSSKLELNHYLPNDIVLTNIEKAEDRFHSRFNAKSKIYSFTCIKGYEGIKPLFNRNYVVVLDDKVNVDIMKKAANEFIGEYDFKGFSSDRTKKSTVRKVEHIEIIEDETKIVFKLEGNGFLYHMVRIIVGTLIEIGSGAREIKSIKSVIKNGVRSEAGYLVPAQGLALEEVKY